MALPRFQEDDGIRERAIQAIAESTFNRQVRDDVLVYGSGGLCCSRTSRASTKLWSSRLYNRALLLYCMVFTILYHGF